jgi:hypothetical protein
MSFAHSEEAVDEIRKGSFKSELGGSDENLCDVVDDNVLDD